MNEAIERVAVLREGAAQWCDPGSAVRRRARAALEGGEWPPQVVEATLDRVLRDADAALDAVPEQTSPLTVLAILPGNILGPAIATAYCAAAVGADLMLKSSSRELHLADIVAEQFKTLGPPVVGTLRPMRWSGGDTDFEAKVFPLAQRIVAFGDDETIADIKRRAPQGVDVVGYGSAYSLGFVPAAFDVASAAQAAAQDVALFDQRGCLSPQTIYVEGDEARCILFAHALAACLERVGRELPRAVALEGERAAVVEFVRRLQVRALPAATHALGTIIQGRARDGVPEYVVGAEPFGGPVCAGFGRIVVVKPCTNAAQAASAAATLGRRLDSVGVATHADAPLSTGLHVVFSEAGALRVCKLGELQQPPLGYRPRIRDFIGVTRT